jgi:TonB-dependent starch-binding outer membrane protein SusC
MKRINQTKLRGYFISIASIFLLLLISNYSWSQNSRTVTGIIKDAKGAPLSGASVVQKGTANGTATNADGKYSLSVSGNNPVLIISYAGYQNKEIAVKNQSTIDVELAETNASLNEVVVTGYSKQSKRDVTGAASTISSAIIDKSPVSDVTGVLEGRVSGVSVDEQGGPGAPQVVRLRGVGTLGNNDPLYVIDGVQIRLGANTDAGSQDISALINPNDIESISVLKDPSLTGLYGAEGANGVIVITTKSGKLGAPKLEYNTYVSSQSAAKLPSTISPQKYANALYQSYYNSFPAQDPTITNLSNYYGTGTTPVLPDYFIESATLNNDKGIGVAAGDPRADPSLYDLNSYRILKVNKAGTNWFKQMFRTSFSQNHQLTLSGATDKSNYMLGLNYFDDNGIIVGTFFKRISLRVNTDFKIKPWLRIGENFQFAYGSGNTASYGHAQSGSPVAQLYSISPLMPTRDIAGNLSGTNNGGSFFGSGVGNPLVNPLIDAPNSQNYNEAAIGSAYIDVEPIKGLIFETKMGAQFLPYQYKYFYPNVVQQAFNLGTNNINEGSGYSTDWRWTNKISYSATINDIHKITAFVVYEAHQYTTRSIGGSQNTLLYDIPGYQYLGNGTANTTVSGGGDKQTDISELGNVTYSLLDKYLLTATLRHDGSSKFGTLSQYGTFPSGSIGWRISKEKFMDNVKWVTDLKLRASYGKIGNNAIPSSQFEDIYSTYAANAGYDLNGSNNFVQQGIYPSNLGDPYIHWETNITTNLGFDAALFNNKLTIGFNWFNRKSKDLLYPRAPIGTQGGAAPPIVNIMSMTNKGEELELGYTNRIGQVGYNMNFNISTYRNNVDYIDGNPGTQIFGPPGGYSGNGNGPFDMTASMVGHPVSSLYGYVYQGIFQDQHGITSHAYQGGFGIDSANGLGHLAYKDLDGNDTINAKDQTFIGNPNPKFTYGFNLGLDYKNFDINIFIQGVYGNKILNYWRYYSVFPGRYGAGSTDTWSTSNTNAKLPIYTQDNLNSTNDAQISSYFVESGSYMRLKSVELGYTFPKIKGITKLRFYVQAYNLLTFTHYSGLDPEVNDGNPKSLGIDFGGSYPPARKFLIGINLGL